MVHCCHPSSGIPHWLGRASVTDICHDWEFFEDGEVIRPISVGLVASDGDEYYAVFHGARELCQKSAWLAEHVDVHFRHPLREFKQFDTIAREVTEFILSKERPQLWAWYGAYDHVALAQTLGGPMINLPQGIPMFTNDIKTIEALVHKRGNPGRQWLEDHQPKQDPETLHHALYDARHDMKLLQYFDEHARRGWY